MLGVKIKKIEIFDDNDPSKHGETDLESFLLVFFQTGVGIGHWGWEKQKSISLITTDLWDSGYVTH